MFYRHVLLKEYSEVKIRRLNESKSKTTKPNRIYLAWVEFLFGLVILFHKIELDQTNFIPY